MRWKVAALIETRFEGPDDEAKARKLLQAELWRLVAELEVALGAPLATSVHIMDIEPLADDAG